MEVWGVSNDSVHEMQGCGSNGKYPREFCRLVSATRNCRRTVPQQQPRHTDAIAGSISEIAIYQQVFRPDVRTTAHPCARWRRGAATLGGRGVCSHAVEGGALVGIGLRFTGAVRFAALHLSATFD